MTSDKDIKHGLQRKILEIIFDMPTDSISKLATKLSLYLGQPDRVPVILCIGSDRVTGDCLGPLTGHILIHEFNVPAFVYGSLASPVNALNLIETLDFVKSRHPLNPVIAVDSSLGIKSDIGAIHVSPDGIYPGAAAGKKLPKVGNISITATVAELKKQDLYGVRLGMVYFLSRSIATAITQSLKVEAAKAV